MSPGRVTCHERFSAVKTGVYCIAVLVVGLGMVGFGLVRAFAQNDMLSRYQPINATVQSSGVEPGRFGGYRPVIQYDYTVDKEQYQARRLTPLPTAGSMSWAEGLAAKFKPEQNITVYVDPLNAFSSFILPFGRFYPYGLILLGAAVVLLGPIPLAGGGVLEIRPVAAQSGKAGWYLLQCPATPSTRAMLPLGMAVGWYVVGIMTSMHYLFILGQPYEWISMFIVVYLAAGLVPMVVGLHRLSAAGRFGQANVWALKPVQPLDQPIIVRFEQPVRRSVAIRNMRLSLVCSRRNGLASHRLFISSQQVVQQQTVPGGQVLGAEYRFEVPKKKRRASSPFERWEYPRIDWFIELKIQLEGGGICATHYPIDAPLHDKDR